MPDSTSPIPDKLAFKIGEAADLVGVKAHVLRFWEKEFPQLRPRKAANGHRLYARADIERLRRIRALLHERGFTIQGARALFREGRDAVDAALAPVPSEAVEALDALGDEVDQLRGEVEAARQASAAARADARKANEEARFWKALAQRAEARAGALEAVVRAEIGRIESLADKG